MRIICLDGTKYSGPRTPCPDGHKPLQGEVLIWTTGLDGYIYEATGEKPGEYDLHRVLGWSYPTKFTTRGVIGEWVSRLTEFERRNLCP